MDAMPHAAPAPPPPDEARDLHFTPAYRATHSLTDGTSVRLRLLRPHDRDGLLAGFARLSPESRYLRFFTAVPRLPEAILRRLLDVDDWNHLALVAEAPCTTPDGAAEGYGIARFVRLADAPDTAEASIAVVDHMQGRGLGKLLLSVLAAAARERGIVRFRAEVLRANMAMSAVLRDFADDLHPVFDGANAVYHFDLPGPCAAPPEAAGGLFGFLRWAAAGLLEALPRRLDPTGLVFRIRDAPAPSAERAGGGRAR